MSVTIFGVVVIVIGIWLTLRGTLLSLLMFVMISTLFSGSAAITLSTGSSILPANVAVLFLALRCVLPHGGRDHDLVAALRANAGLIVFAVYAAIGAVTLPFIFAGSIDVTPLRPIITGDPFAVFPLSFSSQNVTSAGYIVATALGAVGAFVATQSAGADKKIVDLTIAITIIHAAIGIASLLAAGTAFSAVFDFFRNGSYVQVEQQIGGLSRMNGISAEASGYAGYGCYFFVFMVELWLRGIRPAATGAAATFVLFALLLSTSSSGYVAISGYSVILLVRAIVFPASIPLAKMLTMLSVAFVGLTVGIAAAVAFPAFLQLLEKIYMTTIVNKSDTLSGMVRLMWAKQGFAAFWASHGLGVGVGSFRSSSLATAILGSMGVIGIVAYVVQIMTVFQPLRRSTYVKTGRLASDVSAAMAWVVISVTIPAFVAAASPDPTLNWGLFVGMSLGIDRFSRTRASPRAAFLAPPRYATSWQLYRRTSPGS